MKYGIITAIIHIIIAAIIHVSVASSICSLAVAVVAIETIRAAAAAAAVTEMLEMRVSNAVSLRLLESNNNRISTSPQQDLLLQLRPRMQQH